MPTTGLIDLAGRFRPCPLGEVLSPPACGRLWYRDAATGRVGFCTPDYQVAIPPRYSSASDFCTSCEVAWVEVDDQYNLIDTRGDLLLPRWYQNIGLPQCGWVRVKAEGVYLYVSHRTLAEGNVRLRRALDFRHGTAAVVYADDPGERLHYLDTNLRQTLGPYDTDEFSFTSFSDLGLATIRNNGGTRIIDPQGAEIAHHPDLEYGELTAPLTVAAR